MDFSLMTWPSGRVSLRPKSFAARRWLAEQFGPSTPLQLARLAHDAGFDVRGAW